LCGWLLAVGFAVWHTRAVERYLDRVTATQFTSMPVETPLRRIPQAIAPDGQTWVRDSLAMVDNGEWRLRSSDIDNAPDGRPIYWSSAWAWWLIGLGKVRAYFTGEPLAIALESASLWANLPVFLGVLTLASGWVWRRWGGWAGAFTALALAGHRGFYEGFYPAYCDHHGLINASVLGVVMGAMFAGAGWWQRSAGPGFSPLPKSESEVMRAATVSAVCGALGLWVSAASLVVTIGLTGVGILCVVLVRGRDGDDGIVGVPAAWRHWGRVGALLSLGFYLLENFPDRLGMRLEANHPLYSLAWWGAGEAISSVLAWRGDKRSVRWLAWRVGGWAMLMLVAPVVVWMRGAAVFQPLDPFMGRIHASIHEFQPLWTAVSRAGWRAYGDTLFIQLVIVILLVIWWVKKSALTDRLMVMFAGCVALGSTILGCWQNRWLLTASGPQIALALVLIMSMTARLRCGWRAVSMGAVAVLMFLPGPWKLVQERRLVERVNDVQFGETVQLLYRDIAGALRKAGADEHAILLSDPNASVGVGYYGRLRTVGTLYWENRDGLHTAAEILDARDDAEAAGRIHVRGITYVALVSSYDFLTEYDYALTGDASRGGGGINGFGHRLLYQHRVPLWLRPLDYRVPAPLVPLGFMVALFAVDFDAQPSVAHERIGLYQLSVGERALAEESFMASLAADASRSAPWLRAGELMLADGRMREAYNFIRAGVERAPVEQRARLLRAAAALFAREGTKGQDQVQSLLDLLGQTDAPR
jgi:hypothetical protein